MTTDTTLVALYAADCAAASVANGLTVDHFTRGWSLAQGDVDFIVDACGELTQADWRVAHEAFEERARQLLGE